MTLRSPRLAAAAVFAAARSRSAVAKLVLALFILFALPSFALQKGDIDLDCDVDLADVLLLQQALDGQYTLTGDAQENADVAPWDDVALAPDPNSVVDRGDLLVLYRAVAEGWELPSDRPELTDPGATSEMNPITVQFDVPVPNGVDTTIAFTVNGRLQPDTVDVTGGPDGTASGSLDLVVLFDGANEITATSTVAGGSTSCPGVPVTVTYNNVEPRSIGGDLKVPLALTPGDPPVAYTVEQDFNILANPFADPPENGILILQPGVRLRFDDGTRIRLADQESELRIQGEPGTENCVVLTSGQAATRGAWQGISGQTNAAITIDHAVIDYAANPIRANGPSSISNTEIRHFTGTGITAVPPAALQYLVIDNRDDPTLPPAPGALFGTGIEMGGNGTLMLEDSDIRGTQRAVLVNRANENAVVIARNQIEYNGTGITAASTVSSASKPLIESNWIRHHTTAGVVARGFSSGPPANPTIRLNRFYDNPSNLNSRNNPNPGVIIDARYNWWGVDTPASIAGSIVDQLDPPSSDTLVDYVPFYEDSGLKQIDPKWLYLRVDEASTPTPSFAYEALGPLIVDPGTTWAIPEGATIAMPALATSLADVSVAGTLIVNGQAGSGEVAFVAGGSDPQPGEWGGIHLTSSSSGSQLSYLHIRHATSSVSATATDISIANADIGLFTESGVLFDGVTDDSEIVGSVIDGTLDPVSNPSVTVKDNATANVFGIQIIDSYDGCMPGSCGEISGNQLTNLVTGLHVIGDSDPLIIDNDITDNIWGIWLQGTDDGATTAAPFPLVRQNVLSGNFALAQDLPNPPAPPFGPKFRFCSLISGANLCLSDYASTEAVNVVDAAENYWGVDIDDPSAVRASILVSEGQRTAVDVSRFTNLDGTVTLGGPSGILSALAVDITRSTGNGLINAVLRPNESEQLSVDFHLVEAANVKFEVFPEDDTGGDALYSVGPTPLGQGPQTLTWDGTSGGAFVPDGAYAFVLTAETTAPPLMDKYDPPRNIGSAGTGDRASGDAAGTLVDTEFNSFAGDFLTANYVLEELGVRGAPFASRVSARVMMREADQDLCDAQTGAGVLVARPWVDKPLWLAPDPGNPAGATHTFLWDGRVDADGEAASGIPEGTVVVGNDVLDAQGDPTNNFCLFFEVPQPLKPSHVIVDGTLPRIVGEGTAPEIEVRADPFLFDPTYEQATRVRFKVDQASDVKFKILLPGETNLGAPLISIDVDGDPDTPGIQQVQADQFVSQDWTALDVAGDSNDLATSLDGPYTFAIEATSAETNLTSVYRGVVQLRGAD